MSNIFEEATRNKLRFQSSRGPLTVEQLWDVPLRSKDDFNLDSIAREINRKLKDATEEGFVDTGKNPEKTRLTTLLDIVKYIIEVKLDEEERATKRAANRAERDALLAVLVEKQDEKRSQLSEKQIRERLKALEDE